MRNFPRPVTYLATIAAAVFMLTGCLGAGNSKVSSIIEFGFRVDAGQNPYKFDSTLTSGNDKLTIHKIRLVFGGDSLMLNDTTVALIKDKSTWDMLTVPNKLGRNPVRLFSFRQPAKYSTLIFSIPKAPKSASNIDPDFISNGRHYSLIIDGTYNGDDFTYKSNEEFYRTFSLGPVNLPRYNSHFVFIVTANAEMWFVKSGGGFFDPHAAKTSAQIRSKIDSRIKQSFGLKQHSN